MNDAADITLILARLDSIDRRLDGKVTSPWLTSSEAAEYLRCSISQIERLTRSGQLPFSRQNPNSQRAPRLYHRSHLDAYLVTGKNLQSQRLSTEEKRLVKQLTL